MSNLDKMLAQIGGAPLHPRLALMDEAVFSALADQQRYSAGGSLRSLGIAALVALAFGVISTGIPGSPASAAPSVSQFGVPPALTPSSLLLAAK